MGGASELEPGDLFEGRYDVERLLGEGDRKRTYLAWDTKVERRVALSLVKPEAALEDPEGTVREAKVLGRIGSHPNIVSLFDYEIDASGSAEYMVFQYLSGGTLTEYLQQAGPLGLEDILRLGRQLCRGLSHLHKQGLIHRDVSPDNVWLDEHRAAHLGDFDSAITIPADGVPRPITTNSFAAPEELAGGLLDGRCDLYSLGGVLHVAAAGSRPLEHAELQAQRPDLPSAFADLVATLLARSPDDRPADAERVLQWLGEIRESSNIEGLIAAGESDKVEFKASLYHPQDPLPAGMSLKQVQSSLHKSVTKTIAAFLNSKGGTLLIGVSDSGTVLGIEHDFQYLHKRPDSDGWLQALKAVIVKALGPEVWSSIHVSLARHEDGTIAIIPCPRRPSETWHSEENTERFYIRASNTTEELTGSRLLRYIREHWAA